MASETGLTKVEVDSFTARASFLRKAADILSAQAPATSAFLNLNYDRWSALEKKTLKSRKQLASSRPTCKACGCLWTSNSAVKVLIQDENHELRRPKAGKRSIPVRESRLMQCRRCHSITRDVKTGSSMDSDPVVLQPQRQAHGASPKQHHSAQVPRDLPSQGSEIQVPEIQSDNRSAKQRAKARKRAGLQAQLEKSKTAKAREGRVEMDLMDFMSAE